MQMPGDKKPPSLGVLMRETAEGIGHVYMVRCAAGNPLASRRVSTRQTRVSAPHRWLGGFQNVRTPGTGVLACPDLCHRLLESGWRSVLLFCLSAALVTAQIRTEPNPPNANHQRTKPYVVLVSLDGFRHDYAERYGAKNLLELGREGVRAASLIPPYPSLTFPAHYTIVTGLRPARHGMVEMHFYDPALKERFDYNTRNAGDGKWFGGTPLWALAERQGMRAASFFWVGSEAEIQGVRPSFWSRYDGSVPSDARVRQVLDWLRLPEAERPHFVTLYFSSVDSAGHANGPDSDAVRKAVLEVDQIIGRLREGLRSLALPVNLFVVSDHGMEAVQGEWINVYEMADFSGLVASGSPAQVMLYGAERDVARVEKDLRGNKDPRGKDPRLRVYRRRDLPAHLRYTASARIGDLVVVADGPYLLAGQPWKPTERAPRRNLPRGMHGYDPRRPDLHGIFFAAGPDLRRGMRIGSFEMIHIYPLIARILGLEPPKDIDGSFSPLSKIYVRPPRERGPRKGN